MLQEISEIKQQGSLLDLCFENAVLTNRKAALWRLPGEHIKHAVLDLGSDHTPKSFRIEDGQSGFVLSPFSHQPSGEVFMINSDLYLNTNFSEAQLEEILKKNHGTSPLTYLEQPDFRLPILPNGGIDPGRQEFVEMVKEAVSQINTNIFKKVVLARQRTIHPSSQTHPLHLFHVLCRSYPAAFISLVHHPSLGCWLGASPEVLVSLDKNYNFKTMALAGTQKIRQDSDLSKITWNQKEIEEQALVNRYIANCFKMLHIRDYEENGPRTIAAGDLAHLRTDFSVNIEKNPSLATEMLNLLHPTSAVCGMPREDAMRFILSKEPFSRALYAGFLGPVNVGGGTNLFVNIRCARLYNNAAVLYAGAGITKDSDPEREWNETEMKMNTIQHAFAL